MDESACGEGGGHGEEDDEEEGDEGTIVEATLVPLQPNSVRTYPQAVGSKILLMRLLVGTRLRNLAIPQSHFWISATCGENEYFYLVSPPGI